jgi:hypothetical protein
MLASINASATTTKAKPEWGCMKLRSLVYLLKLFLANKFIAKNAANRSTKTISTIRL